MDPLLLGSPQFLDLVHYYRLRHVEDPDELNLELSGIPTQLVDYKPPMMTEAAAKIPVPSWWNGGTTQTEAMSLADSLAQKVKP